MLILLDGVDLDVSGTQWSLIPGTGSFIGQFSMAEEAAAAIFDAATIEGSDLEFLATDVGEPGTQQVARKLTVIGTAPTNLKGVVTLTVLDVRWRWNRVHFKRAYNIRRRSGERRRIRGGDIPLAAQQIANDVAYAPWSLNPDSGEPWTAEEVLKDVFSGVLSGLDSTSQLKFRGVANAITGLPVEGLELDDTGDAAIARALAYMGGRINCYVDWSGDVVVYDVLDGTESALFGLDTSGAGGTRTREDVEGIGEEIVRTPRFTLQNRKFERPLKCRIMFGIQPELRLNFEEKRQSDPTATQAEDSAEARMDNAYKTVEDLRLNEDPLRESIQGQVITFPEALKAFNDPFNGAKPFDKLPDMSVDLIRRRWLAGGVLMAYAWQAVDAAGRFRRRIATIRGAYRTFFRVQEFWNDRIREYRNELVSIEDREDGSRANAAIYADHSAMLAERWFDSKRKGDDEEKHSIFRNMFANEADGPGNILLTKIGDLVQASALMTVTDQDQGLIQIGFLTDFTGQVVSFFRSAFAPETIGSHDVSKKNVHTDKADLSEDHEVSILLSVIPAVPNDKRQLFAIEIGPNDLQHEALGRPIGEAKGPVMEIRIPDALHMARFAWPNSRSGAPDEQSAWDALSSEEGSTAIETGYGPPVNLKQLRGIAEAAAKSVYSKFQDRVEGQLTTALVTDVEIQGALSGVTAAAAAGDDGGLTTTITSAPESANVDMISLLPSALRRIIFRLVDPAP